jgi:uncharacterized membrane-anchored protein YhcB (DUF1043 family)
MTYMRIDTNKFWGWVVVSLLVGLGIGLTIMFMQGAGRSSEINKLRSQMTAQSEEASATLSDLQAGLASAEASVAALTAENSQLTSDLASSQAALSAANKGSSTSSTGTLTITSRSVTPSTVATGAHITLTVKLRGRATKVRMQIKGPGGYSKLYYLKKTSTSGTTQTWKVTVTGPSRKGTYSYFVGAYIGTKKFTLAGSRTFLVK